MKIAIVGLGLEGRVSYGYFRRKFPEAQLVIADEKSVKDIPHGATLRTGVDVFSEQLVDFDLVVRSPSVSPDKIRTEGKVWSATNEFFAECPAQIAGVTGTKGKGTTCSLIASILKKAGKTVHLVGNIGVPALEVLPSIQSEDIVVYELSSFQLWDLEKSPHVAVVLMIEPDHLDVHRDLAEYVEAKANIAKFQTAEDLVIYHPTNQYSRDIAMASKARKQCYGVVDEDGIFVKNDWFYRGENAICSVDTLQLAGAHNRENACAAISAALELVPDLTNDQVAQGLAAFTGLPHRLKYVGEVNGVKYYDDSIATTPGSAIAALRAFTAPKIIILGGSDKGADYRDVISVARDTDSRVIAIGQTGAKIAELCEEFDVYCRQHVIGGMKEIVRGIHDDIAQPGDVVLLSPASASFGMFKDYADRGDQFIFAVEDLLK